MKTETLNVKGMHCSSCEALIIDELEENGVKAKASHKAGTVEVTYDGSKETKDTIKHIIKEEGYEVGE